MNQPIQQQILENLASIEREHQVKILYACESGSRAWGFESPDSDWDVRFLYLERLPWYLSLKPLRDVIERPIDADLDISGWELRKALNLFAKSNPPLLEWLDSPILYAQDELFAEQLRALAKEFFSPRACAWHYSRMAKNNYREFMKGEQVKYKKYLYILRPLLACQWLVQQDAPVPMRMETMVEALLPQGDLKQAITELIERKKVTSELGLGPSIPVINAFIEEELSQVEELAEKLPEGNSQQAPLQEFFQQTLERIWHLPSLAEFGSV